MNEFTAKDIVRSMYEIKTDYLAAVLNDLAASVCQPDCIVKKGITVNLADYVNALRVFWLKPPLNARPYNCRNLIDCQRLFDELKT